MTNPGVDPAETSAPEHDHPGLPWFRSWRGVYLFVFAWFIIMVVLLAVFSRVYA